LLEAAGVLPSWDGGPQLRSDATIVITEHGIVMASCELDPDTRRARRWVAWSRTGPVPKAIMELIERDLAKGLPVTSTDGVTSAVPI